MASDEQVFGEVVDELLARLVELGVPEGTWLLEIEEARAALQKADNLLRRLKDAIVHSAATR